MATISAQHSGIQPAVKTGSSQRRLGRLGVGAMLALSPLAAFGGVNLAAEALNVMPLFFSPVGLPGWVGAAIHLVLLLTTGIALGLVAHRGRRGLNAVRWGFVFTLAMIAFPFVAAPLDSLALALMMTGVILLGLATAIRVARLSRLGGWLMLPSLVWIGFGAALGLAVAAAWSPPFALINAQQPAPSSAPAA
ncbi:hypothetical protein DMC47_06480 [Nostoc sp. 3335mG]|nr:hypothetical protein DMC47_06480 [Nostoc sp. 3335mG]